MPKKIFSKETLITLIAFALGSALIFFIIKLENQRSSGDFSSPEFVSNATIKDIGIPTRIQISKINVDTRILPAGLDAEGKVVAPASIEDTGWYELGPRPGEAGSAVITGHLARIRQGLVTKYGIFNDLKKLETGDRVLIEDDNRNIIEFIVREKKEYQWNEEAPEVFSSDNKKPYLNLITCAGVWLKDKKTYEKRLVIFTELAPSKVSQSN